MDLSSLLQDENLRKFRLTKFPTYFFHEFLLKSQTRVGPVTTSGQTCECITTGYQTNEPHGHFYFR